MNPVADAANGVYSKNNVGPQASSLRSHWVSGPGPWPERAQQRSVPNPAFNVHPVRFVILSRLIVAVAVDRRSIIETVRSIQPDECMRFLFLFFCCCLCLRRLYSESIRAWSALALASFSFSSSFAFALWFRGSFPRLSVPTSQVSPAAQVPLPIRLQPPPCTLYPSRHPRSAFEIIRGAGLLRSAGGQRAAGRDGV